MKKIIIIISSIILAILILFGIDFLLVKTNKTPFLAKKEIADNITTYQGLYYTIKSCNGINALNSNIICPKDKDYIIVDTTDVCAEALEQFYEDENYVYYYPCIKDNTTFIKTNSEQLKISDALKQNKITIEELKTSGLSFYKEERKELIFDKSNTCKEIKYEKIKKSKNTNNLLKYLEQ